MFAQRSGEVWQVGSAASGRTPPRRKSDRQDAGTGLRLDIQTFASDEPGSSLGLGIRGSRPLENRTQKWEPVLG